MTNQKSVSEQKGAGHTALPRRGRTDPYPEFAWCRICGWRKGGKDSWNGRACKCGYSHAAAVPA